MALRQLFYRALLLGFVQDSVQHSHIHQIFFFSLCVFSVYVVHPYSSMASAIPLKKSCCILSDRSDFHLIDNQPIAFHAFARRTLT